MTYRTRTRSALYRARAMLVASSLVMLAACGGGGSSTSTPSAPAEVASSEATTPRAAPLGTILLGRMDGVTERYLTIAADGSDQQPIFEAEECAPCVFLSPDGRRVMTAAFTDDHRLTTQTMKADGTDLSVLPLPNETINFGPGAWSPDGTRLALFGFDESHPSRTGIYIAPAADLSDLTQITTSTDGRFQEPLAWSPDGKHILFFVDTGSLGAITHAGDVFVVSVDGTGLRQLNPPTLVIGRVTASGNQPASWSPDGHQLSFAGFDVRSAGERSAVFVVDLEGGEPRRVAEWGQVIASVDWSPTGEWIAFSDLAGPSASIVRPDGGEPVTLTSSEDQSCCPVWSSDGTLLLIQRGSEGARDLWTMNLDGEFVGQVTREPGDYFVYDWAS